MEAGKITDNQIKASSEFLGQTAAFARLNNLKNCPIFPNVCFVGWAALFNRYTSTWLEVDFQNKHTVVTRVATQGGERQNSWLLFPMWVARYELHYGNDRGTLFVYMELSDNKTGKVSELFRSA